MAQKKKNPAGQLADAKNAEQLTVADEPEAKKKLMTSFYIDPDNYEKMRLIASLRTMQGERNHLGQAVSAGMLMNQAVEEYLARHLPEVEMALAIQRLKVGDPITIHAEKPSDTPTEER